MDTFDINQIKDLINKLDKSGLTRLSLKKGDFSIDLRKEEKLVKEMKSSIHKEEKKPLILSEKVLDKKEEKLEGDKILSPMVGTFYKSPSPSSPSFVKEGESVKKGQVLCILEAMKIMNELEAEFDCKILKVLVEDGQPIEYNMPIFLVKKI